MQVCPPLQPSISYDGSHILAAFAAGVTGFKAVAESLHHAHVQDNQLRYWCREPRRQCPPDLAERSSHSSLKDHMSKPAPASTTVPFPPADPPAATTQALRPSTVLPSIADVRYGSPRSLDRVSGSDRIPSLVHTSAPSSASSPASSQADSDLKLPRPFKMHNILNPSTGVEDRSKTSLLGDGSRASSTSTSRFSAEASPVSSTGRITPGRGLPTGPPYTSQYSMNGRASQSHVGSRVPSLASINLPSGTIDARETPFLSDAKQSFPLESSVRAKADGPHAASPPVVGRPSYGFPQHGTLPDRPMSGAAAPTHPLAQPSHSTSPSTSYSTFGHISRQSSAAQGYTAAPPASTNYFGTPTTTTAPGPQITLGTDHTYGTAPNSTSGSNSSYKLMALDTDRGPIQIPVDVQAASKMADEKRKRNAGASARFRQRRKEKEREASTTIAKLESQIRSANEAREYYRSERDYFRSLVYNTSAQAHVVPRMPSPRPRQPSVTSPISNDSPSGGSPASEWQQQGEERGQQEGRNTRRRISAFATGYDSGPTSQTASPSFPPQFVPPQREHHHSPQQSVQHPHSQVSSGSQHGYATQSATPVQGHDRAWNPHA